MFDQMNADAAAVAALASDAGVCDDLTIQGTYHIECHDADGALLWQETLSNVVATLGKNVMLDAGLAGSAYTVVGPFLGLISATSFSAVAAADTMASHAGWLEAGAANAPTYTGTRATCAWSAASAGSKALSAAVSFTMSGSGTIQGAFLVYGAGAVSTIASTTGVLFSASAFGTPQPVISGNVVTVSYSVGL